MCSHGLGLLLELIPIIALFEKKNTVLNGDTFKAINI